MTFIQIVMLYFSTAVAVLFLVAGGWVKIRDWLKTKAQAKVDAAAAAAKADADKFEAEVQERLKKLLADANDAPEATATSTQGAVASV